MPQDKNFASELHASLGIVPDFPKPGIEFFDISPLLRNPKMWKRTITALSEVVASFKPDIIAAIESRGFIFAAPVATELGISMTMLRKPGKLPGDLYVADYGLEYGKDRLTMQKDAIKPGQRVVILDDVLATGGTLSAAGDLIKQAGGEVEGAVCVIHLAGLKGEEKCPFPQKSLLSIQQ